MQPPVMTGRRLDGRYRLDDELGSRGNASLWRGTDEVLARPVAIRLVPGLTRAQVKDLNDALGRAGRVPDARWVRVLDVGSEPVDRRRTAWVVSEWVEAPSLATLLRPEPMPGPVATGLLLACAEAVAAAHRQRAEHGGLNPGSVLIPSDGTPRITGLELSRRLLDPDASGYDDVRGLGALLYACLTGRWPLPGWTGLPPPSRGDGRHPRQQRGGVGRELDEVTARALGGGYADAAAFARDLAVLPLAPIHPEPKDPDEHRERRWNRWAWRIVPPLLVVAVGLAAWVIGSDLGRVPSPARVAAPGFPQPHQPGPAAGRQVVWSTPPRITSFDPGGDGAEDPGGVGLAVDDDPSTQWSTDTYRDNPRFGGLKNGVGLLLDLGHPKRVTTAELLLSAPGATVELRAGSAPPRQASDLRLVASRTDTPAAAALRLAHPERARYWLLWITSLPKAGSGYRLGVAEIALQH